jgi:hypothetical protein
LRACCKPPEAFGRAGQDAGTPAGLPAVLVMLAVRIHPYEPRAAPAPGGRTP